MKNRPITFGRRCRSDREFIEAHFNLGLIYANQKKMKEAAEEFEAVKKLEPKFEGIHFLLASAYKDAGNTDAAISALEEGLGANPKDLKMLRALAYLQMNSSTDSDAVPTLQQNH